MEKVKKIEERIAKREERIAKHKEKIEKCNEAIKEERKLLKKDENALVHLKYNELLKKLIENDINQNEIMEKVDEVITEDHIYNENQDSEEKQKNNMDNFKNN